MRWIAGICAVWWLTSLSGCGEDEKAALSLTGVYAGVVELSLSGATTTDVPLDQSILITFASPVNTTSATNSITLKEGSNLVATQTSFSSNNQHIHIDPNLALEKNTMYNLQITSQLAGANGETFGGISVAFETIAGTLQITSLKIGGVEVTGPSRVTDVPLDFSAEIVFSDPIQTTGLDQLITLTGPDQSGLTFSFLNDNKTVSVTRAVDLVHLSPYTLSISDDLEGANGESFGGRDQKFYAVVDETPKFPVVSDDALLTLVQQQTFKYFWDFAHPASGMARERNTSGNTVTSGGSGFGIMSIIVGIERNFITRPEGVARMDKIVSFLETADRFHGAWSHWIDGNTGDVIPFSAKDNGGDLVETSFLVQGLITFRQYLQPTDTVGNDLINRITTLWEGVEWDWYRKNNENVLYWHWSPNYNWEMNFAMYGYFEEQITYFLSAASPSHSIPKIVYSNGYGRNGAIVTNNTYYGIKLPLGNPSPLFWVQYSYLGLNPHLTDDYANYWEQNVNASLINHAYCVANPKKFVGYSDACWGLTSSDNQNGYDAHSPSNDLGVITPTAALSSFPYTPTESMKALKFFYYTLGDRLWGEYGFYDAFNVTEGWTASSYLAIDQGPIIVMIENYRTELLWDLFMSAPEVQQALTELSITPN